MARDMYFFFPRAGEWASWYEWYSTVHRTKMLESVATEAMEWERLTSSVFDGCWSRWRRLLATMPIFCVWTKCRQWWNYWFFFCSYFCDAVLHCRSGSGIPAGCLLVRCQKSSCNQFKRKPAKPSRCSVSLATAVNRIVSSSLAATATHTIESVVFGECESTAFIDDDETGFHTEWQTT